MHLTKESLRKIYRENVDSIYKFFFFKTLNRDTAEDLTSETFLELAKKINTSEIITIKSYIHGIARNVFTSFLRDKYKSVEVSVDNGTLDEQYENPKTETFKTDYESILKKILPYLPLRQKVVIEMRFIQKQSIKQIAKKLGKDENYVSTTQKRAFNTIKKLLNVQTVQLN